MCGRRIRGHGARAVAPESLISTGYFLSREGCASHGARQLPFRDAPAAVVAGRWSSCWLSLDDEFFSAEAHHFADRGLEDVSGHRLVPEVRQLWCVVPEGDLVVEQAGGRGDELE